MKTLSPILSVQELLKIQNNQNLVIVDASSGTTTRENYEKAHLAGALYVDLNTQLSNIKQDVSVGGRHPLPTFEQLSKTLRDLGINEKSRVVIYDDKNGANAAARFWWMLRAIGHKEVQVLNGGFQEAKKQGFLINTEKVIPKKTSEYTISNWELPLADLQEVEEASKNNTSYIIDVREEDRYKGIFEPIDLIAGHIPNAINIPFVSNLTENGLFQNIEFLKIAYQQFNNTAPENIIVHCGSGVTACHTLLALDYAGFKIPKLYVGSWSEWSRNNKQMATSKI